MTNIYYVIIILFASCLHHIRCADNAPRPNIVFLIADDLGYGDIGCYGNTTLRTPNIDKLAQEGAKMTQHLTTASMCTPSRAALMTGRYGIRSGMAPTGTVRVCVFGASTCGLPSSEVTLAELAKEAGYNTAAIGKWHLGLHEERYGDFKKHPLNQGFDRFYGLPGTNIKDFGDEGERIFLDLRPSLNKQLITLWLCIIIPLAFLFKAKFVSLLVVIIVLVLWSIPLLTVYWIVDNMKLLNSMLYRDRLIVEQPIRLPGLTHRLAQEAVEFIEESTMQGKPFFLYLAWIHTHTYLATAKEFEGKSIHGRYGDAVEELDWGVGRILEALNRLNIENNTLVYFTSDNGGHVEEKGLNGEVDGGYNGILLGGKGHGGVDGGIRVPGIVRWPGHIPKNTITDEPTSLMDLYNIVGVTTGTTQPINITLDGKNILPLLNGSTNISPHEFLFHYCGNEVHAVRYRPRTGSKTYKLVYRMPDYLPGTNRCDFFCGCHSARVLEKPLLLDMTSDPGEKSPLPSSYPGYSDIIEAITGAVANHKSSIVPVESQFTARNLIWRPHWQDCCNFPTCSCTDPKYV
ncbi:hypothetical protein ACJMK2_006898 [Sinanodonta woodiana]|uniref:Sulfatase N-terminal domain-containing protein n=1 Tax=Sinanodonta woodiana TaxID=1069815 RepID=A0ABD3VY50_SINWO